MFSTKRKEIKLLFLCFLCITIMIFVFAIGAVKLVILMIFDSLTTFSDHVFDQIEEIRLELFKADLEQEHQEAIDRVKKQLDEAFEKT